MVRGSLQHRQTSWLDLGIGGAIIGCAGLVALLPPTLAALLLCTVAVLIATLISPVIGLYLTVASVMLQELVPLPLELTATHIVGAIALGVWVLHGFARHELRIETMLLVPWGLFLATLLLTSALTSYNAVDALKQTLRWILAFLTFVVGVSIMRTPRQAIWLIATFLAVAVIESLIGLWQFWTVTGPESFEIGRFLRAYGTVGKPNTFAGYLDMTWPLGATATVALWRRWRQHPLAAHLLGALLLTGSATAIILAAVGASFSRGAWLGSAVAVVVMIALQERRRAVPWLLALVLMSAVVVVRPQLLPATLENRVSSIVDNFRVFDASRVTVTDDNFAVVERMAHWQAGANMFLAHPLFGVGPGNFNRAYPQYFVGRWSISQGHAHNYYIHIAAEAGIIGLLAYLGLIGATMWLGWRAVQATRDTAWNEIAIGGCGIIAAVLVHNLVENLHVLNFGIHLSAVWALLAVLTLHRGWRI